jgi:hypothetical protein
MERYRDYMLTTVKPDIAEERELAGWNAVFAEVLFEIWSEASPGPHASTAWPVTTKDLPLLSQPSTSWHSPT